MSELRTCVLCEALSLDVKPGLAWYAEITPVDRCGDHVACRSRVEAAGGRWPLAESFDEALRMVPR